MSQPVVKVPVGGDITPKEPIIKVEEPKVEEPKVIIDLVNPPAPPKVDEPPVDAPPVVPPAPPVVPEVKKLVVEGEDGEEIEYVLNANGDALDTNGTLVYTAEQIAEMNSTDEEFIDTVASISGIQILGEDGKPKAYPNTAEGFAQREADIKAQTAKEVSATAIESFFAENQELADMYKYKRTYGSLEGYNNHVDYTKLVINADDKDLQYDIIVKAEIRKGNSPERAKRLADLSKADATLLADSNEAHTYLKTIQEGEFKASEQARIAEYNSAVEAENNYFGIAYNDKGKEVILNVENSIYDLIVTKGRIGDLAIPIEGVTIKTAQGPKAFTRREIFDYISKPAVKVEGQYYTQAEVDEANRISKKENLLVTYLSNLFGNDLSSLVETSKLKDKADSIRRVKVAAKTSQPPVNASKRVKIPLQ